MFLLLVDGQSFDLLRLGTWWVRALSSYAPYLLFGGTPLLLYYSKFGEDVDLFLPRAKVTDFAPGGGNVSPGAKQPVLAPGSS